MLGTAQKELFDKFYDSTKHNQHLDDKTAVLIGLAASMAVACYPCMKFYLQCSKEVLSNYIDNDEEGC